MNDITTPADTTETPAEPIETYADRLISMIGVLSTQRARKEKMDAFTIVRMLELDEDNTPVRDWMVANNIISKNGFDKVCKQIAREERVMARLGFVPSTAIDFVTSYASRTKVSMTYNGMMRSTKPVFIGDIQITEEMRKDNAQVELLYQLQNDGSDNRTDFARTLRMLRDELKLPYDNGAIADAVDEWEKTSRSQRKLEVFSDVAYQQGKATGPTGRKMWEQMEAAAFDVTGTAPGFASAIIQKFMWQVKRKARNLPVTRHLMPVLTGVQEKGKSTYVLAMLKPIEEMVRAADFKMITDERVIDIWNSYVLFLDEMGFAHKADADVIKNVITAGQLTRRPMRENNTVQVAQKATLIGCSNKTLAELIRDDTGVRRFAELVWRQEPDLDALNSLDWLMMWQSVDEAGPDPVEPFQNHLREQQEANREQNPIEMWARGPGQDVTDWTSSSKCFEDFAAWEKVNFPRNQTSLQHFGRSLAGLMTNRIGFPFEKMTKRSGVVYRAIPDPNAAPKEASMAAKLRKLIKEG